MNEYIKEYRGFLIKPSKTHPSVYDVVTSGQGGKVPVVLNSMFTDRGFAMEQIDAYLESKDKKGEKVEKDSTGGGK